MKTWQVLVLCFSIIISVAASAFYLKYEPKTIVKSDAGMVDLGKVFAEKVMIDITLIDYAGNEEVFVDGVSFYNSSQAIAKALISLNNNRNNTVSKDKRTTYNKVNGYDTSKEKLKIRTYITYYSSNFKDAPYTLVVAEQTQPLQGYTPLNDSIYSIVDRNFKAKRGDVASELFMTNENASIID